MSKPRQKKQSQQSSSTQSNIRPGPAKSPKQGGPSARLSNHKTRSIWFQTRATWPHREAPINALVAARRHAISNLPTATPDQWVSVGPSNIGGRMTSAVCDPAQPQRLWAGAAGGGVWHSEDGGLTWQAQWHAQPVLNIGALALDPANPQVIYCGTGEANLSADSYPGVGLFRTTDGGQQWDLLATCEATGLPRRIGVIALDPFDSQHLLLGGIGYDETLTDLGGLFVSRDGGVTWKRETFISTQNYWCHSVVFDPKTRGTIYATFTERGSKNGIYRSLDGGQTWTQLTGGLPSPARFGRTTLAISPSNPKVLYAFATDQASGRADLLLGVFRTANGGKTWQNVAKQHFAREGQISYGNTIAVHPKKPNHVICGGVDLHLSQDGGQTWRKVTRWDAQRGKSNYAHADHHCLLMPTASPGLIYDLNDGGLDVSTDGGLKWQNRSNGLAVTMYYDLDVSQVNGKLFGGGTQDNGTLITETGKSDDHSEILGGDGGWIVFDPHDINHLYASYYNLNLYRWRAGQDPEDVSPPAPEAEKERVWMAFIAMDPNDSKTVFTGSARVWRTKNDGAQWSPVSQPLDGSTITAIEIATADSKRIYVGTTNGGFFRSLDGGATWSANLASATLPGFTITRLAADPTNADVLYATVANFGRSHVYRSRNGGVTWKDIDQGRLPDVPHQSIAIPRNAPQTLYVCNDVGVFVSPDQGQSWLNLTGNLPAVMVVDLTHQLADNTFTAATYGRSLWRLQLTS